jgi:glycine cleavage system pyridoxal-binding protein P
MLPNSEKDFLKRHIGPSKEDQLKMLKELNYQSLDDLIDNTVPEKIKFNGELNIGESNSEYEALRKLRVISKKKSSLFKFYWHGLLWNIYSIRNFKKYLRKSRLVHFVYTLSARGCSRKT